MKKKELTISSLQFTAIQTFCLPWLFERQVKRIYKESKIGENCMRHDPAGTCKCFDDVKFFTNELGYYRSEIYHISNEQTDKLNENNKNYEIKIVLYPKLKRCNILYCFKMNGSYGFKEATLLRQRIYTIDYQDVYGRGKKQAFFWLKYFTHLLRRKRILLKEKTLLKDILGYAYRSDTYPQDKFIITEIKEIDGFDNYNVTDFINNNAQEIYGIIVGDEGWEYFPEEVARQRINKNWSSRVFFSCFSIGLNNLIINLKHSSSSGKQYIKFQNEVNNDLTYFKANPCIAGMDHCFLNSVEKASILKFDIKEAVNLMGKNVPLKVKTNYNRINNLITKHIASFIKIEELNELSTLVFEKSGVSSEIEMAKYMLSTYSEKLKFKSQYKITWLGLLITILGVLIATLATYIAYKQYHDS